MPVMRLSVAYCYRMIIYYRLTPWRNICQAPTSSGAFSTHANRDCLSASCSPDLHTIATPISPRLPTSQPGVQRPWWRETIQYFSQWFDITPATDAEQRLGIDRHFLRHRDRQRFTVEYKTDHTAGRTGNAFVETISVDTANKPGWAFTSTAQVLIYHVPDAGTLYIIDFPRLRHHLPTWQQTYPTRAIPNRSYHTHGLLVPLKEFEAIAGQALPI